MASQFRTRNYRPFGFVHITARGLDKQQIIFDDEDREEVLRMIRSLLNRCPQRKRPTLIAYALMDNNVHFLFQHGSDPRQVGRIMHVFKRDFARRFNARSGQAGPVWQSPYRGRVVRGGVELINAITYIHLNPDASIRETNSSHGIYLGERPAGIVNAELAIKAFGGRAAYAEFFADTARIRAARAAAKTRINQ